MTRIMTNPFLLGMTLLLAAFAAALAINSSSSSALSLSDYQKALASNGYSVSVGAKVDHPTLSIDGVILTVTYSGKSANVEFLDYGSQAALKADWTAEDGKGPEPKVATSDFDGKVLYWYNDSVLVVDYNGPNDPLVARGAANSYLGLPGTGGEQPASPTPGTGTATPAPGPPTATPRDFPSTGGPLGDDGDDGNAWALGLAIFTAAALMATVVLARSSKERS